MELEWIGQFDAARPVQHGIRRGQIRLVRRTHPGESIPQVRGASTGAARCAVIFSGPLPAARDQWAAASQSAPTPTLTSSGTVSSAAEPICSRRIATT